MKHKWLSWQVPTHMTLMTWVQVPGLAKFHIIFPLVIACRPHIKTHHAHSKCIVHVSQEVYQRVQNKGIWWMPVNMPHLIGKVNGFKIKWARISRPAPHNSGATPHPGLPNLFIFFIFFIYFNCYVYLIN